MRFRNLSAVLAACVMLTAMPARLSAASSVTVRFDAPAAAVATVDKIITATNGKSNPGGYVAFRAGGSNCATIDCNMIPDVVVAVSVDANGKLLFQPRSTRDSSLLGALAVSPADAANPTTEMIRTIVGIGAETPAQGDLSIGVVFFPAATDPKAKSKTVDEFMSVFVATLNSSRRVYTAWRILPNDQPYPGDCPSDRTASCRVSAAKIFVRTAVTPTTITMSSFDAQTGNAIATTTFTADTTADSIATNTITGDVFQQLLGTASVVGGNVLAVTHGFEQYIQLIPETAASPSDPDYGYYLEMMLRERGISAFRSAFTTVSLNAASDSSICSAGQRYLVYSVSIENDTKKLIGHTRVSAAATGTLLDCVGRQSLSINGQRRINVPTTASTLGLYAAMLATLYTKFGTGMITFAPAFGALVDGEPTSVNTRGIAAAQSLQRMVDNFCTKLPLPTPTPIAITTSDAASGARQPPATSTPAPRTDVVGNGAKVAAPAAATGATAQGLAFNPGPITGAAPYAPKCTDPKLSHRSYDPVHGVLTRHWFGVQPSPSPSPTPPP
jgi:hypothetical protein